MKSGKINEGPFTYVCNTHPFFNILYIIYLFNIYTHNLILEECENLRGMVHAH